MTEGSSIPKPFRLEFSNRVHPISESFRTISHLTSIYKNTLTLALRSETYLTDCHELLKDCYCDGFWIELFLFLKRRSCDIG